MSPKSAVAELATSPGPFCPDDLARVTAENEGRNPFIHMPANAQFLDVDRALSIALSSQATLFSIKLDRNEWARLSMIGLEPDTLGIVPMADVQFLLQVNRATIRTINNQIGAGDNPTVLFIKVVQPGSEIRLVGVNNNAVTAATMFARLIGWSIPF